MTAVPESRRLLVLVRHGESVWNRSLRLTGWEDVPLSERGREQAFRAALELRAHGIVPDVCYCSELQRAAETLDIMLTALGGAPARRRSWRLNERHYGAMQGLSIWGAAWRFGPLAVLRCGRELDARPPLIEIPLAPASPAIGLADLADEEDRRRAQIGESIADALRRLLPLWQGEIAPSLRDGAGVLMVAHNNLLRGLLHHLAGADRPLAGRLATARPLILELDDELRIVKP